MQALLTRAAANRRARKPRQKYVQLFAPSNSACSFRVCHLGAAFKVKVGLQRLVVGCPEGWAAGCQVNAGRNSPASRQQRPAGSKYSIFQVSGPMYHPFLILFWNQKPQILSTGTLWESSAAHPARLQSSCRLQLILHVVTPFKKDYYPECPKYPHTRCVGFLHQEL